METLEAPIMAETAVTQEPAPALLIPILPKEENIPAKQMGQAAPLVIPTLPSVNTEAAASTTPEPSEASVPAAPVFEAAEPAANPFDDARKPASPETDSSVSSEEPPLTVLEPVVDTSKADPAPVPTPPVVE